MEIIKWKHRDLYESMTGFKSLQDEINDLFDIDRFPITTGLFDRNYSPDIGVIEGE